MIENNYFTENTDILLHFEHLIPWSDIIFAYENDFADHKRYQENGDENLASAPGSIDEAVDYYRVVLENTGELTGSYVAPIASAIDKEGLRYSNGEVLFPKQLIDCIAKFQEAGLAGFGLSRKYGGISLPMTTRNLMQEIVSRGDSSVSLTLGTIGIAEIIELFAPKEISKKYVSQVAEGELWSAMALTEPNHGSDLSNITTKAEQDETGQWRITGTKRFITQGCGFNGAPSVILTLARTGSPNSKARGLSFFLVLGADTHVAGIEKKLGIHCSPTCEIVYENSPAILIGKKGLGLTKYAMEMMNGARLAIATQALGVAQAALSESQKYASERKQFGVLIKDLLPVKKDLNYMESEVTAMRCLLYESTYLVDIYMWEKNRVYRNSLEGIKEDKGLEEKNRLRKAEKLAHFFTPMSKYYISELCNDIAYKAIQIHGGSGYTEDYDVARIYRDARITSIYEGTTHLQVLAIIGGISAGMAPSGYLREYIQSKLCLFKPSPFLNELLAIFEEICDEYRSIPKADTVKHSTLAFEVVQSAARFLMSLLLELSIEKLESKCTQSILDRRRELKHLYQINSKAIMHANLIRIKSD